MSDSNSSLIIRVGTAGVPQSVADLNRVHDVVKQISTQSPADFGASIAWGNQTSKVINQVSADAKAASGHIGGMVYQMRAGIDAVRYAAAGGGARAAFYSVDEAVRGLIQSGLGMSVILPVIAGVAAAAGAGVLVWREYKSGIEDVVAEADALNTKLTTLSQVIGLVQDAGNTGLLSGKGMNYLTGLATGNVPTKVNMPLDEAYTQGRIPYEQYSKMRSQFNDTEAKNSNLSATDFPTPTGEVPATADEQAQMVMEYLMRQGLVITKKGEKGKPDSYEPSVMGEALIRAHDMQKDLLEPMSGSAGELQKRQGDFMDKFNPLEALANQKADQSTPAQSMLAKQLAQVKAQFDKQYQDAIKEAASKTDDSSLKAQVKDATQIREEGAKEFEQANKTIEDQITDEAQKSGKTREDFYKQEYDLRMKAATEALYSGEITEDQYKDAVREAQQVLIAGQNKLNEALQRETQLRNEIARTQSEAQLKGIQDNPFLTDSQKAKQTIPIYQQSIAQTSASAAGDLSTAQTANSDEARLKAMDEYYSKMQQVVELQKQLSAAQGESSFTYQFKTVVAQMESANNLAKEMAGTFQGAVTTAINSIAQNMTKVIDGTETWQMALKNIGESIVNEIIEGLIKAIAQMVIMAAVTELMKAVGVSVGTQKPNPATEAQWGGAGMMRSIADLGPIYGPIAFAAEVAVGVAMGAGSGFLIGGYTGDGSPLDAAGIVHRGEYVFSAPAVDRIGVDNLDTLHQNATAGSGGDSSGGSNISNKFVLVANLKQAALEAMASPQGEKVTMGHIRKNKNKMGFQT